MFSFSIVLIDHRGKKCLKEALNFCKVLYSYIYISASSWNEKILQHSDESDNVGDDIKNTPLDEIQRNNATFITNHERNSGNP